MSAARDQCGRLLYFPVTAASQDKPAEFLRGDGGRLAGRPTFFFADGFELLENHARRDDRVRGARSIIRGS